MDDVAPQGQRPPDEADDGPLARRLSRAEFVRLAGLVVAGTALGAGCGRTPPAALTSSTSPRATPSRTASPIQSPSRSGVAAAAGAYLAVAKGTDAKAITAAAITAIGGMSRFVRPGANVIIKPNICVGYHGPEYAATTNPDVIAALVELCVKAGASRVRVMDNPFGSSAATAYRVSGIADAVRRAGGHMETMSPVKFVDTHIPRGKAITHYPIYRDILRADLVINVPIAKQHPLSRLTLGGKNLFGCVVNRQNLHFNLSQCVADLTSVIKPELTVVDAVRILTTNGPTGGSLSDVSRRNTVIASADVVAADSYAATLFGLKGADVPYVKASEAMGLGTTRLKSIHIARVSA